MPDWKAKPDDRSDNVEKLQAMIENTIDNMEEARTSRDDSNKEQRDQIDEKNKRRLESIDAMRSEIKDEYHARQTSGQHSDKTE